MIELCQVSAKNKLPLSALVHWALREEWQVCIEVCSCSRHGAHICVTIVIRAVTGQYHTVACKTSLKYWCQHPLH